MPFIDLGDKKSQIKLLVAEFMIIFISVVLAFFFEDYRESRNERNQYRKALLIFGSDLNGQMQSIRSKLDSFKVDNLPWSGAINAEVQEYLWLDSLIDQKKAKMVHFKYFHSRGYFDNYLIVPYVASPLSEEIRVKHGEHASNRLTRRMLAKYDEGMRRLAGIHQTYADMYRQLYMSVRKTDPNANYQAEDSLIFYSNEFRTAFKKLADLKRKEYGYLYYLTTDHWWPVAETIAEELESLGIPIPENAHCYRINKWQSRFECWEKMPPENSIPIDIFLRNKRTEFFSASD